MATVILFIVEGPSDETALIIPLYEKIIQKKLRTSVKVMHGDISTKFIKNTELYEITSSNIKKEIISIVSDFINRENLLKSKDLLKIFYITDTDRCFSGIESHHTNKKSCLTTLFNTDFIPLGKGSSLKNIPFDVIFMNENLEHLLTLESRNFSDKEKEIIATNFSEECEKDFQKYIDTFKNDKIKFWTSYRDSYTQIRQNPETSSNMNNFLDEFNLDKIE